MTRMLLAAALLVPMAAASADDDRASADHVLMVSVDGLHAQDLERCLAAETCPHLAKLARHGMNHANAYTPGLSDSMPPLAARVTRGSPRSTGVFDDIHVQNIVNQIDGKDSTGARAAPVPTIFGTNFQTLSVAQKALSSAGGDYFDAAFTANTFVVAGIVYIDRAIGRIADELEARRLSDSTLFIITSKHGQLPADRAKLLKVGHSVGRALAAYLGSGTDPVTGNNLGGGQVTDDDVTFVWLRDPTQRDAAVNLLGGLIACPRVDPTTRIVPGATSLICADNGGTVTDLSKAPSRFGNPADGRTPNLMVRPNPGLIYTTSGSKDMEPGGYAPDDGHEALLV